MSVIEDSTTRLQTILTCRWVSRCKATGQRNLPIRLWRIVKEISIISLLSSAITTAWPWEQGRHWQNVGAGSHSSLVSTDCQGRTVASAWCAIHYLMPPIFIPHEGINCWNLLWISWKGNLIRRKPCSPQHLLPATMPKGIPLMAVARIKTFVHLSQ